MPPPHAALAAGALGTLGIAGFRLLYGSFYAGLGVGIDEVGLTTWQMVTAGVAGMLTVVAYAMPGAVVARALFLRFRRRFGLIETGMAATIAFVVTFLGVIELASEHPASTPIAALVGLVLVAAAVGLAAAPPSLGALARWRIPVRQSAAWTSIGVLVFTWVSAYAAVGDAARAFRSNKEDRSMARVVLDVPRWPVCIDSASAGSAVSANAVRTRWWLLGASAGTTVLLERGQPSGSGVLRLPSASVSLRSRAADDTCP